MEKITQLFSVLWAPRKTLWEISQSPRVIAPLVLLTLFAAIQTFVVFAKLDPGELRLQEFERGGYADKISASDKVILAQAARNQMALASVFTIVGAAMTVIVTATAFFLILGAGRGVSFRSFLAVTAFAFIPGIFHSIAMLATVLLAAPTPQTLLWAGAVGPIRLLEQSAIPRIAYLSLSAVDLVSFWILALLIVGYGFLLRDRVKPAFAVIGLYLLWSAVYIGLVELALGQLV